MSFERRTWRTYPPGNTREKNRNSKINIICSFILSGDVEYESDINLLPKVSPTAIDRKEFTTREVGGVPWRTCYEI